MVYIILSKRILVSNKFAYIVQKILGFNFLEKTQKLFHTKKILVSYTKNFGRKIKIRSVK